MPLVAAIDDGRVDGEWLALRTRGDEANGKIGAPELARRRRVSTRDDHFLKSQRVVAGRDIDDPVVVEMLDVWERSRERDETARNAVTSSGSHVEAQVIARDDELEGAGGL